MVSRTTEITQGNNKIARKPYPKGQYETFSRNLRNALEEKGWNRSQLARQASRFLKDGKQIGRDSVSMYCNGKSIPGPIPLSAISRALGLSPEDLLPGSLPDGGGDVSLQIVQSKDRDGMVHLRINQDVSMETAVEIMSILKKRAPKVTC